MDFERFTDRAKNPDADEMDAHLYVGKNVLNLFRQDHGYRDGRYRKSWQGREDNEVLAELLPGLDSDARDFRDVLYRALAARYAQVADA